MMKKTSICPLAVHIKPELGIKARERYLPNPPEEQGSSLTGINATGSAVEEPEVQPIVRPTSPSPCESHRLIFISYHPAPEQLGEDPGQTELLPKLAELLQRRGHQAHFDQSASMRVETWHRVQAFHKEFSLLLKNSSDRDEIPRKNGICKLLLTLFEIRKLGELECLGDLFLDVRRDKDRFERNRDSLPHTYALFFEDYFNRLAEQPVDSRRRERSVSLMDRISRKLQHGVIERTLRNRAKRDLLFPLWLVFLTEYSSSSYNYSEDLCSRLKGIFDSAFKAVKKAADETAFLHATKWSSLADIAVTIVKHHGCRVDFEEDAPLPALAVKLREHVYIHVDKHLKDLHKFRLISHELGHVVLNHRTPSEFAVDFAGLDQKEKEIFQFQEIEADLFASACLFSLPVLSKGIGKLALFWLQLRLDTHFCSWERFFGAILLSSNESRAPVVPASTISRGGVEATDSGSRTSTDRLVDITKKSRAGGLVKTRRVGQRLTQKELGERIGVSQAAISHLETGDFNAISPEKVDCLLQVLGITELPQEVA